MTADDYRAQLARLGLNQTQAGMVIGVDARTSRRYACGEREVPVPVQRLLWACGRFPELLCLLLTAD